MSEYLIRTTETHEWPVFRAPLADVLIPPGFGCNAVDGWGDFRMSCSDAVISFSGEEVGWQLVVEGAMTRGHTEALVSAITEQVARACGEPCEWLSLG